MCYVDGCHKTQYAKGYCRSHYYRNARYGDPRAGVSYGDRKPVCREGGCGNEARIKGPQAGFCTGHGRYCGACGEPCRERLCGTCSVVLDDCYDPEKLRAVADYIERMRGDGT